jgi:putative oxidoreductase
MMKASKITRLVGILLGTFLTIYAANQFLHFLPAGYGKMPDFTREYLDAMLPFLPALYIFELVLGIFLITNKWTPFIIIVLAPLSINFLIFNLANGGWNIFSAGFVALMNFILIYMHKEKYKPLFQ